MTSLKDPMMMDQKSDPNDAQIKKGIIKEAMQN